MLVRWYFKTGFKYERRVNGQCQVIGRLCPVKSLNDRTYCPVFYISNEPVIIHRRGGGGGGGGSGGFGAPQGEI